MTRWERLEAYLFDHDKQGTDFTVHNYAADGGLDIEDAKADIQAYLDAQRRQPKVDADGKPRPGSTTLYVIRRVPGTRTRNARWAVGVKTQDARLIGGALSDDVRRKVMRAFAPDLLRLGEINPRAGRQVRAQLSAVVDHTLALLDLAAQGVWPDEDEDDE